jgi:hypothetical protein
MDADHGFVDLVIPLHGSDDACLRAVATADAFGCIQPHTTLRTRQQRSCRAYFGAWRVITGFAHYHFKSTLHASSRFYLDAGRFKSCFSKASSAGKHALLTTYAAVDIFYQ